MNIYSPTLRGLKQISLAGKKRKNYRKRKEMWKAFFDFKELFADVKYTFASTIHKLQGSTHATVYIDLFGLANNTHIDPDQLYRLVYVAMTRASTDIKILIPSTEHLNLETIEEDLMRLFRT